MEVVTYLTSTLIVATAVSLVIFGFWFDTTRRRRSLRSDTQAGAARPEADLSLPGEPELPTRAAFTDGTDPSLEGFVLQHAPIERDLHVYGRLAVFGAVLRPVTVHAGGVLVLFGPCIASIQVRRGGQAAVYGVVTGDLVNDGGEIDVYGNITGTVHEHAGRTWVHPS